VLFYHLEIPSLSGLDLQLQFVCDQGDKFAICGFSLHVGDGVAEVFLQGFQAVYRIVYSYKMLLFSGFLLLSYLTTKVVSILPIPPLSHPERVISS
jgi:hypothetical protein